MYDLVELKHPEMPDETIKTTYPTLSLESYLSYDDILANIPASHKILAFSPLSMEKLPINDNNGQSYGYIIYRSRVEVGNGSMVEIGRARDVAQLIVDGNLQSAKFNGVPDVTNEFGYWLNT